MHCITDSIACTTASQGASPSECRHHASNHDQKTEDGRQREGHEMVQSNPMGHCPMRVDTRCRVAVEPTITTPSVSPTFAFAPPAKSARPVYSERERPVSKLLGSVCQTMCSRVPPPMPSPSRRLRFVFLWRTCSTGIVCGAGACFFFLPLSLHAEGNQSDLLLLGVTRPLLSNNRTAPRLCPTC